MTERLTPEEYQERMITGKSPPEQYLDKHFAWQESQLEYLYGVEPEPTPEEEKPSVQYVPIGQAPAENSSTIPWALIGVIAITGIIAVSIVTVVVVKK